MPRLLVVEDEGKLLRSLERGLSVAGYTVAAAASGAEGYRLAMNELFDCAILDWMLPGRDGITILRAIRETGRAVPVMLLTARDAIDDRVFGLDSGANDYLVKPFALAELLARLRVLMRGDKSGRDTILRAADLDIDLVERTARRGGKLIELKQREFAVLEYLARHKNATVTREMLGRDVWGDPDYALTNVIEVYINLLRRKLDVSGSPSPIFTVRGVGYCLKEAT